MPSTRRLPAALLALAVLPLLGLGGCSYPGYYPGGSQASLDEYTYESTHDFPQSVHLIDHVSGEVIWSVHVPIGQQVVMRFYENHDPSNTERPTLMRWEMMPRGKRFGKLNSAMPVPPYDRRRLDVQLRKGEIAPGLETSSR